jgi:hypothetical protein
MKRVSFLASNLVVGAFVAGLLLVAGAGEARDAAATTSDAGRVSFRRDVAPVLATSCATRSCHGGGSRPPVLGAHMSASTMRAALVGVASEDRPDHAYVEPGAPDASYLVQKVEGRLVDAECTEHDCGEPMPLDNPSLSAEAIAKIRAWVADGARDN